METVSTLLRSPLLPFFGPLLLVIAIAFFWWRSGSIYSLLERVWRLVAGKAEVSDEKLKKFILETRDVEKFRFMFGLKVERMAELHKLLEWLNANSIGISKAQMAKRWINAKTRELIPVPKYYLPIRALGLVLCVVALMLLVISVTSSDALLQMKGSKTWFLADATSIKGFYEDWVIEPAQCPKEIVSKSVGGLTNAEVHLLCEAFKDGTFKQLVSDTVRQQRILGLMYGLLVLIGGAIWLRQIFSATAAIEISKELAGCERDTGNR
jgi:hypothetical protein